MAGNDRGKREDVMQSLREDIAELTDDPGLAGGIREHDALELAGVDSFVMLNLIIRIEQRFGVSLADRELHSDIIGTLGGLADSICAKRWEDSA